MPRETLRGQEQESMREVLRYPLIDTWCGQENTCLRGASYAPNKDGYSVVRAPCVRWMRFFGYSLSVSHEHICRGLGSPLPFRCSLPACHLTPPPPLPPLPPPVVISCHQIPPYDAPRGRKCSYFRVDATVSGPPDDAAGWAAGAADAEDGRHSSSGGSSEGVAGLTQRVTLQEIPEPGGLPQWGQYRGPRVNLR